MKKNTITLYVNDPMGKRWLSNMDAAGRAEKELGAEVKVLKKTSKEYAQEKDPPPCPSVAVNCRFIARNDTITYETLKTTILIDSAIWGGRYAENRYAVFVHIALFLREHPDLRPYRRIGPE